MAINTLFVPYCYQNNDLSFGDIVYKSGIILLVVSFICSFRMIIIYFSKVNQKLDESNEEHIKLLNGMDEGVLIINQKDRQDSSWNILFYNKAAR